MAGATEAASSPFHQFAEKYTASDAFLHAINSAKVTLFFFLQLIPQSREKGDTA